MKCDECKEDRVVTIVHSVTVGSRVFEWRLCVPCNRQDQQRQAMEVNEEDRA